MASHTQQQDQESSEAPAKGGMRVETWIFIGLTGFFLLAAVIYTVLAPTEAVGIVALFLTAGLTLIIGTFLLFRLPAPGRASARGQRRRRGVRRRRGYRVLLARFLLPVLLGRRACAVAVATAYLLVWLMVIGVGFLLFVVCGFIFEYHRRPAHH